MRRWQIWRNEEGAQVLQWARVRPPSDEEPWTVVREFESANWMTAEKEAFGTGPKIDRGMKKLVELVHRIPGLMTVSCCEGHLGAPHKEHTYLSLHVDDAASLSRFVDLLQFAASDDAPYFLEIILSWAYTVAQSMVDVPPGAMSITLSWEYIDDFGEAPLPARLLSEFTETLRQRAAAAGVLSPAPLKRPRAGQVR